MDRTFLAAVAATVALLAVGLGAGVYLGGTGAFDERPRVEPQVTGFVVDDVTCVTNATTTPKVDTGNTTRGTFVIVRTNVTLPDTNTRLTNATIESSGLANYTLSLEEESATDGPTCEDGETPIAFTQVFFQVPHPGEEPFGVTVTYRDDALFRIRNSPEGVRVIESDA